MEKKIITSIIQNKEVDSFVYDFIDGIEKNSKIEKKFFVIFLLNI